MLFHLKGVRLISRRILVIADDLTGANDTGLQFARCGLTTNILLRPRNWSQASGSPVEVVNTDSRALTPRHASEQVRSTLGHLQGTDYDLIFKKIDSTLRGNIGSEIDAVMDSYELPLAVVVPAYPGQGRYTVGGYHMVHESLLEDSEAARDPRSPVRGSFIPSILEPQTRRLIGHVDIATIRAGALTEKVEELLSSDHTLLVFDSTTIEDLRKIVAGILALEMGVLWVGSAGLAQVLAERLVTKPFEPRLHQPRLRSEPVLIVAGSCNNVTYKQVDEVVSQGRAEALFVPADRLSGDGSLEPHDRQAVAILESKENLVLTISRPENEELVDVTGEQSSRIASRLGQLASQLIGTTSLAGVVLTGGDIALQTCTHLGVTRLQIVDQVAEGIPLSLALDGALDSVPIITKAGGFGDEDVFLRVITYLRGAAK